MNNVLRIWLVLKSEKDETAFAESLRSKNR